MRSIAFDEKDLSKLYDICISQALTEEGVNYSDLEFSLELIENALEGRIDFDKLFSLKGYNSACRKNQKLVGLADEKHYIRNNKSSNINYDETDDIITCVPTNIDQFDNLLDDEEVKYSVIKLKAMRTNILLTYTIDVLLAMKSALKGIPSAVESMKALCEDASIAETVHCILNSGYAFEDLFSENDF